MNVKNLLNLKNISKMVLMLAAALAMVIPSASWADPYYGNNYYGNRYYNPPVVNGRVFQMRPNFVNNRAYRVGYRQGERHERRFLSNNWNRSPWYRFNSNARYYQRGYQRYQCH